MGYIEVTSAFENKADADACARYLRDHHLAASIHCYDICSYYIWEDDKVAGHETVISCLTKDVLYDAVEKAIIMLNPYVCTQVTAKPIVNVSESFKAWLDKQC